MVEKCAIRRYSLRATFGEQSKSYACMDALVPDSFRRRTRANSLTTCSGSWGFPGTNSFPTLRRVKDVEGYADAVVDAIRARAQDGAAGQTFELLAEGRSVLGAEPFHQLACLLVGSVSQVCSRLA